MASVEWGEYKLDDLFEKVKYKKLKYKASELRKQPDEKYVLPALTAGIDNQGLNNYVPVDGATILQDVISISANGANTGVTFFQTNAFTILQDAYAIDWKQKSRKFTRRSGLFIASIINSVLHGKYEWTNKANWGKVREEYIALPKLGNQIDFDFMDSFIAELEAERIAKLEAYLKVSGLDNYELSVEELKALRDYDSIDFEEFEYQEVFDKIVQGRRLKKDDQIPGDIPFVMSGVTNTGIVNFISNPVASFPRNSITLDIFGNAFYRPYAYGAGDDTGVYWNEENEYSKEVMLYITSSMSRSVAGKYDYGNKLRSSKSKNIKMKLPAVSKGVLDTDYMRIFTNAVMKLAIKDVVQYTNERIETTKEVVTSHNTNY
ncbi:TPA: restriction endonuclease subunit S [Streptococcus suis]